MLTHDVHSEHHSEKAGSLAERQTAPLSAHVTRWVQGAARMIRTGELWALGVSQVEEGIPSPGEPPRGHTIAAAPRTGTGPKSQRIPVAARFWPSRAAIEGRPATQETQGRTTS